MFVHDNPVLGLMMMYYVNPITRASNNVTGYK